MSHDPAGMGEYALRSLDKLYRRTDLPAEVLALKEKAYAARHAGNAAWCFMAGDWAEGAAGVRRAVELDPGWLEGVPPKIIHWLVSVFAHHPLVDDRDEFLAGLAKHFPDIGPQASRLVRQEVARDYLADVFGAGERDKLDVRRSLLKGLVYDPSWLRHAGVWSIGVEAFVGAKLASCLRSLAKPLVAAADPAGKPRVER